MKNSYLPHALLAVLLAAALLTLVAGGRLAREEEVVRTQVGRAQVGDLAAEMMAQLRRLDYYPESRTLDQRIAKLRQRIERDPTAAQIIEAVRGVGYRYPGRRESGS